MVNARAERMLGQRRLLLVVDAIEAGVLLELGTEEVLRCWTSSGHRNNGEQTGDRQHVEWDNGCSVFFGLRKENVLQPLQAPGFIDAVIAVRIASAAFWAHDYPIRYLIAIYVQLY